MPCFTVIRTWAVDTCGSDSHFPSTMRLTEGNLRSGGGGGASLGPLYLVPNWFN